MKKIKRHIKGVLIAASSIILLKLSKLATEVLQIKYKGSRIEKVSKKVEDTINKIESILYPIINIVL